MTVPQSVGVRVKVVYPYEFYYAPVPAARFGLLVHEAEDLFGDMGDLMQGLLDEGYEDLIY